MAGVDVSINGAPVWNTTTYSVEEDATPIDATSTTGGSPAFSVGTNLVAGDKSLSGLPLVISDGADGRIQGHIRSLNSSGALLTVGGYTDVSLLNTVVQAAPFSGTLVNAITYLLGLVGFTTTDFQVDTSIASTPVLLAGFSENLQDKIKELCSGLQIEMSYVDNAFIFRPLRTNIAQVYRNESIDFSLNIDGQARAVSALYYNSVAKSAALAYPVIQPDLGADIQQVSDGQVITVNLSLKPSGSSGVGQGVSLASVQQPQCVDSTVESISSFSGPSAYSILDSNNNPYPAASWVNNGGSIMATIDDDTQGLTLTITGPNDVYGPYRIAGVSGTGDTFFNSLRLVGNGIWYNKQVLTIPTGLTTLDTGTDHPPVIDNFAINTIGDANSALLSSLRNYSGPQQSISVTTTGVNTTGKTGEYTLLTFGQWDTLFGGIKFSAWDTSWGGKTFAQYDAYLFSLVRGQFANQAFGNVAGSRVLNDNSWYRISSARITQNGLSYTAIADNTFRDWDAVWGGKTFAQWDAAWGGKRFIDYTPYLMSAGPSAPASYFMSSSRQDFSNLPGLGFEHFPNRADFHARD